jgi:hypothetical protein
MAEAKTKQTEASVTDFIDKQDSEQTRDDCRTLVKMMKKITGKPAKMWGPAIVGFGKYHYKYESGHEGDSCIAAFSPRKGNLTVYIMDEFPNRESLLKKLGKHKSSKVCLYIKKLEDIDLDVLEKIVKASMDAVKKKYPDGSS